MTTDQNLSTEFSTIERSDARLFGWAGPDAATREWDRLAAEFDPFFIAGQTNPTAGRTARLWDLVRKVLKQDTPNYPQGSGDCVSFGAKNAVEYLECAEIARGDAEEFRPAFPPYLYATGRVLVGNGRMAGRAGSVGSWMAKAVIDYGVLRADLAGVPPYSGAVADRWGNGADFRQFLDEGRKHPVRSAARIDDWDALVAAIVNGYPCTIASNAGFAMKAGRDGFHARRGVWPHQMCVVAAGDDPRRPWAGLLNSWGDVHGRLDDFETNEPWPAGTLRVTRDAVEDMLRTGECFAYSQFDGFPQQDLFWGEAIG
jgi:hypothetical protein